ncbi:hypothetical protein EC957_007168 [Mortierella hygrophila]|uniref:ArfGap-domain-containing protein n=1 Tax=Mortierella hygrophila TaxID=979708 RepID=A0A9P6K660_9FUNG|nr:hypothetical protein EC957_007168 [Mortierella hygrophila]
MAPANSAHIPSSLSQPDPAQCNITVHNATSSPAVTVSVQPNDTFAVRSHTLDRIEYVQDPEPHHHDDSNHHHIHVSPPTPTPSDSLVESASASGSASGSEQEPQQKQPATKTLTTDLAIATATIPIPALLLKVQAGGGVRLLFDIKGTILDSLTSSNVPQGVHNPQEHTPTENDTKKNGSQHHDQNNATTTTTTTPPSSHDTTASATSTTPDATITTAAVESPPVSVSTEGATTTTPPPATIVVSEADALQSSSIDNNSNADLQQSRQAKEEGEGETPCINSDDPSGSIMKDYTISEVIALPNEHNDGHYEWEATYTPKENVEDVVVEHKAVFAFLYWDPSSASTKIVAQFSLWIVNVPPTEQCFAGPRYSLPATLTSSGGGRHWRRASTPERFSTSVGKLPSFHTKFLSIPASHGSLPSLPEVAVVTQGGSGSTSVSPSSPQPAPFAHDTEDGPLFRATVVECENNIRDMKAATKRILKAAQAVVDAKKSWVIAEEVFIKEMETFKPAEPLVNSYLRPMSQSFAERSEALANQMRSLLIEPLTRFYGNDIKAAEAHRKAFDDESKDYYQFLSKYMAMKQESNRKKGEADAKYEKKRRHFEIKRFEYWGFLLDMRVGGSKSDEILHHLTNYSEKHCRNMVETALLAESLKPGLDMIAADLLESHKRAATVRKERQERRKELLESQDDNVNALHLSPTISKGGSTPMMASASAGSSTNSPDIISDSQPEVLRGSLEPSGDQADNTTVSDQKSTTGSLSNGSLQFGGAQQNNQAPKFSGIRDLEHQDIDAGTALGRRKEGFLFATSRPSMHNNSAVLEKPNINWHKYWCVLSEGHMHEYSHWKKGAAAMLHNEPINLRISTVRACRNQDRRFTFEVITPKFRRVYQATSAEDMNSWISVISNAIQSLLDGTSSCQNLGYYSPNSKDSKSNSVFGVDGLMSGFSGAGRSSMEQMLHGLPMTGSRHGHAASGSHDFGRAFETPDMDHLGTRLLQIMRDSHPANNFCAECGAKNPDWCAINLGILICIECSGIHRSLGTHISKVRSFTLDTTSYTRDLFDFIRAVGNEISNKTWEANLVQSEAHDDHTSTKVVFRRPLVNDSRDYKDSFIQKKYVERAFVDRKQYHGDAETQEEQAALITKALFNEVTANNIPGVIAAFAAGADLNAIQEVDPETDGNPPGAGHFAMGSDDTTGSSALSDSQLQANLESLSMGSETSSRYSRSTIASSILNAPGAAASASQDALSTLPLSLDARSPSQADRLAASFTVMQTSPLLLALRNGVQFSLDDLYEVYPLAEFMLQNGAASNLSVKVRMVDEETETSGQVPTTSDGSVTEDTVASTPGTSTSPVVDPSGSASSNNGWDSTVDPEDIKHFQQRSNRRSLGQVVHMRGEGGGSAMEYLRSKSAARGDPMPGSPPINGDSSAGATFSSPPNSGTSLTLSPRLRPQGPVPLAGSVSAPTSAVSSPSAAGSYPTNVYRQQQPSSMQQDLSSLFVKRRESDGGLGTALFAANKATSEASEKSKGAVVIPGAQKPGSGGEYTLQNAANISTSPTNHSEHLEPSPSSRSHHHHQSSSLSTPHGLYALSHSMSMSGSRANKVKAQLSKSLRLSAAYIKNNMMKEDKESPVPTITHTVASPPSAPRPSIMMSPKATPASSNHSGVAELTSEPMELPPSISSTPSIASSITDGEPLSGPYVFLMKKGSLPPAESSTGSAAATTTTTTTTATTSTTATATSSNAQPTP